MEGAYLPGNIRQRMQELMKEHKITQAQLATRIGSTESAISRFVSGKTDKISTEHLLRKSQCRDRQPPFGKPSLCRSHLYD